MTTTTPVEKKSPSETPKIISKKKVITKSFAEAKLFIKSTFNNTLVTVTDPKGNTLAWSSSGRCGFKGSRKSTPFAATTAIERALEEAKKYGIKTLSVYLKGPGTGRDAALRYLRAKRDFEVSLIADITQIHHNGPRPPKQRRA
ncbi:MAG: 30S ribosomal protein S11 [Patescibacteria group bacterium]